MMTVNYWEFAGAVLLAVLPLYVTHYFVLRQMRRESRERLNREHYARKLDALHACYRLLRYTSNTKVRNSYTIITAEGEGPDRKHYFSPALIDAFVDELPEVFYGQGAGLYLSSRVKSRLFEYRDAACQLRQAAGDTTAERVLFADEPTGRKMMELHRQIIELLKEELDVNRLMKKKRHKAQL